MTKLLVGAIVGFGRWNITRFSFVQVLQTPSSTCEYDLNNGCLGAERSFLRPVKG
jgi:hypothetical protein